MTKIFYSGLALILIIVGCNKQELNPTEVEIRFQNLTELNIDSAILNINLDNIRYKITDFEPNEITDYQYFEKANFDYVPLIFSGENVFNPFRVIDLQCCLPTGKYRVDIILLIDEEGKQIASTEATKED